MCVCAHTYIHTIHIDFIRSSMHVFLYLNVLFLYFSVGLTTRYIHSHSLLLSHSLSFSSSSFSHLHTREHARANTHTHTFRHSMTMYFIMWWFEFFFSKKKTGNNFFSVSICAHSSATSALRWITRRIKPNLCVFLRTSIWSTIMTMAAALAPLNSTKEILVFIPVWEMCTNECE